MTLDDSPSHDKLVRATLTITIPVDGGLGDHVARVGDTCCCVNRSGRDYKRISIGRRGSPERRMWKFHQVHEVPREPGVYLLKACWFAIDDNHAYVGTHGTLTVIAPP
jgi:hypothetical protein